MQRQSQPPLLRVAHLITHGERGFSPVTSATCRALIMITPPRTNTAWPRKRCGEYRLPPTRTFPAHYRPRNFDPQSPSDLPDCDPTAHGCLPLLPPDSSLRFNLRRLSVGSNGCCLFPTFSCVCHVVLVSSTYIIHLKVPSYLYPAQLDPQQLHLRRRMAAKKKDSLEQISAFISYGASFSQHSTCSKNDRWTVEKIILFIKASKS